MGRRSAPITMKFTTEVSDAIRDAKHLLTIASSEHRNNMTYRTIRILLGFVLNELVLDETIDRWRNEANQ